MKKLRRRLARSLYYRGKTKSSRLWRLRAYLMWKWPALRRVRRTVYRMIGPTTDGVPEGVVPFVVLTSPRTGSNLLLERLSSQWPSLRSDGESFSPPIRGSSSVNDVIGKTYFIDSGHQFVGCKILASQIDDVDLESVLRIEGLRVIVLERRNVIRQFVSLKVALADGIFSQPAGTKRSSPTARGVEVETEALLTFRDGWNNWRHRYANATRELSTVHIYYEDLEEDIDREIKRIADFVGLGDPDVVMPPRLRRQNPEPLSQLITNFEELRAELLAHGEHELVRDLDG